jgi:hypothetical protein
VFTSTNIEVMTDITSGPPEPSKIIRAYPTVFASDLTKKGKLSEQDVPSPQRAFAAKFDGLEQRLKSKPSKLPVAKTWQPESVTYLAEFVVHEGALYPARLDN